MTPTVRGQPSRFRWLVQVLQVAVSLAVLAGLVAHARVERVADALRETALPWLLAAVVARSLSHVLHELRLWFAMLPWRRLAPWSVVALGLVGGLLNVVLPFRGGDVVTVALLHREQRVPASVSLAVVGLVGFLEAAVFGVFLLGLFAVGWARWSSLLGADAAARAVFAVTLLTGGGIAAALAAVFAGRWLAGRGQAAGGRMGGLVRELFGHAHLALGRPRDFLLNVSSAAVQLLLTILGFILCLPATHIEVEAPVMAASGVLAVGALAGIVLPPSLLAAPAAASVLVLGTLGVPEDRALAFAGLAWLHAAIPSVGFGLPPLWVRLGTVGSLLFRRQAPDGPPAAVDEV